MKIKYRIVFLKLINSVYTIYRIIKLRTLTNDIVTIQSKSFVINYSAPCYFSARHKTYMYFVDIDSGNQLSFQQMQSQINPNLLKIIVKANVMSQLSKSLTEDVKKPNYIMMLIGLALGLCIGAMGMYIYLTSKTGV